MNALSGRMKNITLHIQRKENPRGKSNKTESNNQRRGSLGSTSRWRDKAQISNFVYTHTQRMLVWTVRFHIWKLETTPCWNLLTTLSCNHQSNSSSNGAAPSAAQERMSTTGPANPARRPVRLSVQTLSAVWHSVFQRTWDLRQRSKSSSGNRRNILCAGEPRPCCEAGFPGLCWHWTQ